MATPHDDGPNEIDDACSITTISIFNICNDIVCGQSWPSLQTCIQFSGPPQGTAVGGPGGGFTATATPAA